MFVDPVFEDRLTVVKTAAFAVGEKNTEKPKDAIGKPKKAKKPIAKMKTDADTA